MTSPPAGSAGQRGVQGTGAGPDQVALDAAEALFRAEWARLVGAARLLLDEPADAEEVTQEAFVQLLRHWDELRDPDRAGAWLRTTVVNLSRARLRRRLVVRRHPVRHEPDAEPADGTASTAHDVARVGAALALLPRRQRECIVLRHWSELELSQIAATLGISVGSVKTHLHRAMATLGDSLEDERD